MSDDYPILLKTNGLRGRTFRAPDVVIGKGETGVVLASDRAMTQEWTESVFGLVRPPGGSAEVLGFDLARLREGRRLALMARIAFVSPPPGNLVSNLKVWENIVFPAHYHGAVVDEEVEAVVVEALGVAGFGGGWVESRLPAPPDRLDTFESRVVCLVRAVVSRPALLFGEMLFDDLEPRHRRRLQALLAWMRVRQPDLGVLLVLQSDDPEEEMGLIPEGQGSIITLEEVK